MKKIPHTLFLLLLLVCTTLFHACSDEEKDPYKEIRESMSQSAQIGIYQNGKAVWTFDKQQHQYYCNPSKATFRFTNMTGSSYLTIQLDALPTASTRASGNINGTMGIRIDNLTQLYPLKEENGLVWYWSDETGTGMVVPKVWR